MSPWILFVFALHVCRISANKYCSLESNGEPKYFICARNEYCCHFGCCVHLAFQFYQLWYYWLLLIFMFMLCSGGSWWYKFCRHNETSSSYPSLPPTFEGRQGRQHAVEASRRHRSMERSTADNSFYFQRIWKANGMGPPPNYYTASVVRYHSASELETRRQQQECPYYQLYGPPPSYESVVRIPESGLGQPSCTLGPAATPAGQHIAQQQAALLNQPPPGYAADSLPGMSGFGGGGGDVAHVALVAGQHASPQQQQIPVPSTSIQVDFVPVPVHNQHHQQHAAGAAATSEATCRASCAATSPLQFRAAGCRVPPATPSTATATKLTGTVSSPLLSPDDGGDLPRALEDQV